MGEEPRGVLIVTLKEDEDVEEIERRVSKIGGVVGVEFNHLTRKLLVSYGGDRQGLRRVESELKKVLEGKRKGGTPPPHHIEGKRRR